MLNSGEVMVWRVQLDALSSDSLPPLLPEESARAERFHSDESRQRYIRSHGVLRAILGRLGLPTVFARDDCNKPFLPSRPEVHFNLSRSHGMGLYAVSLGAPVGVDLELIRPLAEHLAIAERFLPPTQYAELMGAGPERRGEEFFRIWTRLEAALKALGVGLYGAGEELSGDWTIAEIDAGEQFAAAVAVRAAGYGVILRDFI